MNLSGFLCIGYNFYVGLLVLILEVIPDFFSLVMISLSLPGFPRLGLDVYGLARVFTYCKNNEKA